MALVPSTPPSPFHLIYPSNLTLTFDTSPAHAYARFALHHAHVAYVAHARHAPTWPLQAMDLVWGGQQRRCFVPDGTQYQLQGKSKLTTPYNNRCGEMWG